MMNNYQNPYMPYAPRYSTPNNSIVWVQGIEGAKAYQLASNSNIILMDSENDIRNMQSIMLKRRQKETHPGQIDIKK